MEDRYNVDLMQIREELDIIDSEITALFQKRMQLCRDVAEYKLNTGKQVLDKKREEEKLEKLCAMAENSLNRQCISEMFSQIMSFSRKLQYQLLNERGMVTDFPFEMVPNLPKARAKVVYQGVEGAYSHAAMRQFFGEHVDAANVKTWDDAMKAICAGTADYAVLPIENSSAGAVSDVYDLLSRYDNYIVGETYVTVDHVLLGCQDAELSDIQVVYSHPQGLMQCSRYLGEHKNWKTVSKENTAVSAKQVFEEQDKTHAAVASKTAGELYGLKVLADDIMNNDTNVTRFVVISSRKMYVEKAGKISICFEVSHTSGSLYLMLAHFIYNNLNMTKIESRPIPGRSWEYRFFLDFEGNLSDPGVKNALRGVLEEANFFRILGNY